MLPLQPEKSLPDPTELRPVILLGLMTADFKDSMIARALHHRSQLPDHACGEFDSILNAEVMIPKFPKYPAKAPLPLLKQAILRDIHKSDRLMVAVLKTWFISQSSLRDLVIEHLSKRNIVVDFTDFEAYQFNGYWPYDDWSSLCDEILEAHGSWDRDEVALMLCGVTCKLPMSLATRAEDKSGMMKADPLHQALIYLKELSADSPQWEADVPTFLSSIAEISEEKAAERAAMESLEELTKTLSEFRGRHSWQLEYFEIDIPDWTRPPHFNTSILAEAHRLLERLSDFFEEHKSIPEKGSSLTETRHLNKKREEVEDNILRVKSELDEVLTTGNESDEAPYQATSNTFGSAPNLQTEVSEVSADATLADLQLSDGGLDFNPTRTNYTVVLPNRVDNLTIALVPNVAGSAVDLSVESPEHNEVSCVQTEAGSYRVENIGVGHTSILVTVTAEDGATNQTYELSVERAPSDDATLRSLHSTAGELEFDPAVKNYSIDLANGVKGLSVTFQTTHASATVIATLGHADGTIANLATPENGVYDVLGLGDGQTTLSLSVTAENGITTHTYRLTLTSCSIPASDHTELMWSLVAEDDLAGAYWISKSLVTKGLVHPLLPTLLKASQAARWLSPESRDFVEDLFMTVSDTSSPFDDDTLVMLGLAASIQSSIVAPETNLLAWLNSPTCLPSLERIVSPIRDFASLGHALRPNYIRGDEWHQRLQGLIKEASSNAHTWLGNSSKRYHNLVRANNVWRHLCTDNGMLNNLLRTVADDHRSEIATVKSDVEALGQEAYRVELINETDQALRSSPKNAIAGAARDWLHRGIIQATTLATRWCDLVDRENDSRTQSQNQWLSDHVAELRTEIAAASQDVLDDLSTVASDSERGDLVASALCLTRSIHRLLDYLSIKHDAGHLSVVPSVVSDLWKVNQNAGFSEHDTSPNSQIEIALSRRLLWIPAVDLTDDGLPANGKEPIDLQRAEVDWFSSDTPLEAVVRSRIDNGDFRFLELLSLDSATGQTVRPEVMYSSDLVTARETLEEHRNRAREAVEQATSDGVIEFEGAHWSEWTHSLEDITIDKILNFRQAHDILEEIVVSVKEDSINRREELTKDWTTLIRDLRKDTNVALEVLEELSNTFKLASDDSLDIRVMEDCVSRIRNYRSGDLQNLVPARLESSHTLEDFLQFCENTGDLQPHATGNHGLKHLLRRSKGEE